MVVHLHVYFVELSYMQHLKLHSGECNYALLLCICYWKFNQCDVCEKFILWGAW